MVGLWRGRRRRRREVREEDGCGVIDDTKDGDFRIIWDKLWRERVKKNS